MSCLFLGKRIATLRKKLTTDTQVTFASRVGIHRSYLAAVETGVKNPTFTVLKSISKALGITLSELFKDLPDGDKFRRGMSKAELDKIGISEEDYIIFEEVQSKLDSKA
jgi:transcriptional regulator with XRE-family HTH domain